MELAIPLIALGSLFIVSNQSKKKENFSINEQLPNADIPDKNYPDMHSVVVPETDITSSLSVNNHYSNAGGAYTDKYFKTPNMGGEEISKMASEQYGTAGQYYSLTGDKVDINYFNHDNMQPYFSGSNKNNITNPESRYNNDRTLDSLLGQQAFDRRKTEQSPLFLPEQGSQWAYGMPSHNDYFQSRAGANLTQKMNNVNPFKEQPVAPGLGGIDAQPQGYNTGLMARDMYMDKSVDDLRVANRPKTSALMYGREGPAMSRITERGILGKMEKNRPERAFEMSPERYFTTTGAVKGATLHAIQPDEKTVNRATTGVSYVGGAGAMNPATYTEGEYMPSTHQDLGQLPYNPASAVGRSAARSGEYGFSAQQKIVNNRSTTDEDEYFGAVKGAFHSVVAPLLDVLRPTKKEAVVGNMRPYENAKGMVAESYYFNPADRPAPTIRDTYVEKHHMNINRGQRNDGYCVAEQQVTHTNRNGLKNLDYVGGGTGSKQLRPYDAEYGQRNNDMKTATLHEQMVGGNMKLRGGDITMHMKQKEVENGRDNVPRFAGRVPDQRHIGEMQRSWREPTTITMDRANPDILDALKSNPYVIHAPR